jgi:formylglycine-generating enzyme required for sulfatase activity
MPRHAVDIPYDYYMARFPITNQEYAAYMRSQRDEYLPPLLSWRKKQNHLAVNVSRNSAVAYARWLNDIVGAELPLGLILRLPTEAEGEKAARGTKHLVYP